MRRLIRQLGNFDANGVSSLNEIKLDERQRNSIKFDRKFVWYLVCNKRVIKNGINCRKIKRKN